MKFSTKTKTAGRPRKSSQRQGMTLMEVVIAIGVVAVVIPMILAALGNATGSRRNAEADTHSAWLAKEARRQVIANWAGYQSDVGSTLDFPTFGTEAEPQVLVYNSDGEFLSEGSSSDLSGSSSINKAAYIVTVYGETHTPPNLTGTTDSMSLLHIRVLYPAKSQPAKRNTYRYNLITPKEGIL